MNVKWAMRIDRAAGLPLGWLLRALHAASRRPPRAPGPLAPPADILVLKCLGFGSIIQMAPMLATLRTAYPHARITLLTFEQNAGLAALIPAVDEVVTIDFRRGRIRFVWETLRQVLRLRARRPGLLIDCEFFSYYVAFLTRLIARGEATTIGYFNNRRSKDWIFTHAIAIDLSEHISASFQKALAPLALAEEPRPLEDCGFRVPQAARDTLARKLQARGIAGAEGVVVVNVNASDLCLNRRWPASHFQSLLQGMAASPEFADRDILLIGAPEDREYVAACHEGLRGLPRLHDFAGETTLAELAALFSQAALFIGNDSGPLHLAEAYGLPSLSFFGPETPNLYGPRGGKHQVFYMRPHCSPCLNVFYSKDNNCKDNICMKAIAPDEVLTAARLAAGQRVGETGGVD